MPDVDTTVCCGDRRVEEETVDKLYSLTDGVVEGIATFPISTSSVKLSLHLLIVKMIQSRDNQK